MSKRILLADDSLTIQKVVELTFMDEDFEVEAVGSGDEAISRLQGELPNILIADVHMPGASGYEVCRQAKGMSANLPVLLLVGTFEALDEDEMAACGADGNLKKPFDSQELLQVVQRMARGEAPSRSEAPAAESPAADVAPEAEPAEEPVSGFESTSYGGEDAQPVEKPSVTGFDLGTAGADTILLETGAADAGPADTDTVLLEDEPELGPVDLGDSADYRREASETPTGNETVFIEALPQDETEPSAEPEPAKDPELVDAQPEEAQPEEPRTEQEEPLEAGAEPVAGLAAGGDARHGLSDADVERVARRVVELMSDDAVREVAWDVIPDMAEIVIKERIRQLESDTD